MKVLALTPFYLPIVGGIELLVADLARELRPHGMDIVVLTDTAGRLPAEESVDGTRVRRLDLYGALRSGDPSRTLSMVSEFGRVVDEIAPDVIHLHSATQAAAFFLERFLRKRPKAKIVITQHGVLESEDKIELIKSIAGRAVAVTSVSHAGLASILDYTGFAGKAVKISNGVRAVQLESIARTPPPGPNLLCVGRLQLEKGFDVAIRAVAMLASRRRDLTLRIIGYGENARYFEDLAEALGIEHRVEFLGVLDHSTTRQHIAEASILIVPSRTREGFSLVAAEAAFAGTPCITSNVGGLPETVVDQQTGLVVPVEDVPATSAAIETLLDDAELWQRMSQAGKARARDVFDITVCARQYAALYRGLTP